MDLFQIICELLDWCAKEKMFCNIFTGISTNKDYGFGGHIVTISLRNGGKGIDHAFYCPGGYLNGENFNLDVTKIEMDEFLKKARKELGKEGDGK